jgi:hypothetical protein
MPLTDVSRRKAGEPMGWADDSLGHRSAGPTGGVRADSVIVRHWRIARVLPWGTVCRSHCLS